MKYNYVDVDNTDVSRGNKVHIYTTELRAIQTKSRVCLEEPVSVARSCTICCMFLCGSLPVSLQQDETFWISLPV